MLLFNCVVILLRWFGVVPRVCCFVVVVVLCRCVVAFCIASFCWRVGAVLFVFCLLACVIGRLFVAVCMCVCVLCLFVRW